MIGPRWRKVISDLLSNKGRTLLVILSIAVGVFAVGYVMTTFDIMLSGMDNDYQSSNPHGAMLYTSSFKDEDLAAIRRMPGVDQAEGRTSYYGRTTVKGTEKGPITVSGMKKPDDLKIDKLKPLKEGDPIPALGDKEIYLERSSATTLNAKVGDMITIEDMDGKHKRELKLVGIVHDVNSIPYIFSQQLYAYANPATINWLGGSEDYTTLYLSVKDDKTSESHVKAVANEVADKFKKSGSEVYFTLVYQPGRHFASDITKALAYTMGILGALTVFLSAFLVVNTISALLSQQIRQIGMMKAIGGQTGQIIAMYLMMVIGFGALALVVAFPLSTLLGYSSAQLMAGLLNFNVGEIRIPIPSLIAQISVAIGAPLLAAILPIIGGTRVTIREAISSYGLGAGQFGKNIFDRAIEKIRFLSRPLIISLRNAFRRKARMMLTLSTLTLAGAIFIAVFNLQGAFDKTIQATLGYFLSDINITFDKYYRTIEVNPIVKSLPGVKIVEAWAGGTGQVLSADKKNSTQIELVAPPSDSVLITPTLVKGRWIVPGDENAVVIDNHLLAVRPELKVGDNVIIKINDKEYTFKIVGQYQIAGNVLNPLVYTDYEYLTKLTNQVGKASNVRVKISPNDPATQDSVRKTYETALKAAGITVTDITTGAQVEASNKSTTSVLVYALLVMSVLIALVGGLGLSGTMSMNIIERTREIGVMRAIGASDREIASLVVVEGLLIGTISWILGTLLALPISYLLDYAVGIAFIQSPLDFVFQPSGCIIWLVGMLIIAAIASLVPARNASRLTVREVLAYE
jgi:putative ABC transport system permease protein